LEEEVLENGKIEKHKTVIKEHGGKVEVVEYS
jgi:ribosomal protein S6